MNDLTATSTSRRKMNTNVLISSEIGSEGELLLGHPQLIECMGIMCCEPGACIWTKGSDIYLHIVKKIIRKFFLTVSKDTCPWRAFLGFFSRDFFFFFWGGGWSVGQIIYMECIVFRGSNTSCTRASSAYRRRGRSLLWLLLCIGRLPSVITSLCWFIEVLVS